MSLEEYVKRTKETSQDTKILPSELLEHIYIDIANNEIRIPEENPEDDINGKLSTLYRICSEL